PEIFSNRQSESRSTLSARLLATVFRIGCFRAFHQRNRFLFGCGPNGSAERSLYLGLITIQSCQKYTAELMQSGAAKALLKSFSQRFRLVEYPKSFSGTIHYIQCFGLLCQPNRQGQHRTGCSKVSYSLLDPRNAFPGFAGNAARPTAVNLSGSEPKYKI